MKENGGLLVDTKADDSSPVSFVVGQGQVLVGLENRVIGMAVGESWKATFGPDEAFGHVTPDRVVKVPLRKDDEGQIVEAVPQIGHVVHLSNGAVGTVVDTTEDYVEIDTNHKMAGKDIEVELTLLEIKDELEEAWSGIRVETVAEGDNLNYPNNGDMVHVHYTLQLASNGKVVDSSTASGRPLSFQIGMGRVIAGWDQGILRLSLGERARLYVASEFGYGSQGAGGGLIPPNENLVFDVELVGINELRPPSSKL
ncbi:Peptidyl-prolyl cis-trans isomerase [Hondaea fermentalgiana]|uniref:peptidylprolyl isomerase n=1 Tax=Hondaea fermentalgiana TaxID=2315210 RepID=A0A2R5GJ31_9STRA|nr:Peptidyl-prolyl cis-trans isomerase [Hondaea fermentalgiana]|eukprot:GBG28301.1 Peptidyl-prolyl cis-trans isomerase [Hondaea fermentalgiana]